MVAFELSFDYRCPFAKNLHLHLISALRSGAEFDVTFVPWTLSQGHKAPEDLDVWDDPLRDGDLLALAAGVSVRDQQPEHFLNAHEALFVARHVRSLRLHHVDEVADVLGEVHVDVEAVAADIESRRPHQVIAESYQRYERYEAFGVPTLVANDDAVFIRYMDPPTNDAGASVELMSRLVEMTLLRPSLNEFKHTRLPA